VIGWRIHDGEPIHSLALWAKGLLGSQFSGKNMSGLIKAVVALVLVAGIMIFLASRVSEQKMTRHEKPVSLDALNK
jgi:hypothetical protein